MKKLIAFSLIGLLVFTGCGKKEEQKTNEQNDNQIEQIKANTNPDVIGNKELEEFTFTNTSMIYEKNETKLEVTVTNVSDVTAYVHEFNIYAKDAEGNIITTFKGFVGDNIPAGEFKIIKANASIDLTNAASISYEIVR